MMDYKIVEERSEGGIIYQKVRFYEGNVTIANEYNPTTEQLEPVERYRRTALIDEVEYEYQ